MNINILSPCRALNKGYLKQNVSRIEIDTLKVNLQTFFEKTEQAQKTGEHEEHFKNIVSDFLKNTWYKSDYELNTGKRKDLVIHDGKSATDSIGVIIEAKKPDNFTEMISSENLNTKALHELILYYFEEREQAKNIEINTLIATNAYEWFLFDENEFDKLFYRNSKIQKLYKTKIENAKDNPFFYSELQKIISESSGEIVCTYINLTDYATNHFAVQNSLVIIEDDAQLIDLYKILSPEHLLKKPFANDSNTLNSDFYNELLHVIGLEEKAEGGKKIIVRKSENKRDGGSLLENTISFISKRKSGLNSELPENEVFSIALELCITWLNRILFLKLLEGQLIKYHNGNPDYLFLNTKTIKDYDELQELFFDVLAVKPEDREKPVTEKFGNIPYLNSSLFEDTEFERNFLYISNLKDRYTLPLYSGSVLRNKAEFQKNDSLNTLRYIFEFLSAYNFSSETGAKIQEDNKTIINASVLGLIFEKINGYQDGSFFTPGFITMYMSREAIRRAVAQKFRERENTDIETFDDVKKYCAKFFKHADIQRFNAHINALKICDPAVGSGHFLVSALNELIAVKSELNILTDTEGTPLDYEISVANDELVTTNKRTNRPFEYVLGYDDKPSHEVQKVQVALFHEKQSIIENCLFGVDINPKSVLICRLRLWIELLKNAYYIPNAETHGRVSLHHHELQTLPNIDINIKTGNSLISRFSLDSSLKQIAKASKWTIFSYQNAVESYKKSTDKKVKYEIEKLIKDIKINYINSIQQKNPTLQKYYKLKQEYDYKFPENGFFVHEDEEDYGGSKKKRDEEKQRLGLELQRAKEQVESEKTFFDKNNAFEWRFEFPEVLNEDGDFIGFDCVIGNPPYGAKLSESVKDYFSGNYKNQDYQLDTYLLFIEHSYRLIKEQAELALIIPNTWLTNIKYRKIRKFIIENSYIFEISHYKKAVFKEAVVDTEVLMLKKVHKLNENIKINNFSTHKESQTHFVSQTDWIKADGNTINIFMDKRQEALKSKIESGNKPISELFNIFVGIKPYEVGKGNPKQTKEDMINRIYDAETKIDNTYKKLLRGSDIHKYINKWNSNRWIKYGENIAAPRKAQNFEKPKIVVRQTGDTLIATFDDEQFICMNNLHVITQKETGKLALKYLLALVNSKLMDFYHSLLNPEKGEALAEVKKENLKKLPIKDSSKKIQAPFIGKANKIIALKKANPQADTSDLEDEINRMVYKLYELTDEEIAIVEHSENQ